MKPRFRLPFDANRHGAMATQLRLLLATTAASWMGLARSNVPGLVAELGTLGIKLTAVPNGRCNEIAIDGSRHRHIG